MAEPVLTLSDDTIANLKVEAHLGIGANAAAVIAALAPAMYDQSANAGRP